MKKKCFAAFFVLMIVIGALSLNVLAANANFFDSLQNENSDAQIDTDNPLSPDSTGLPTILGLSQSDTTASADGSILSSVNTQSKIYTLFINYIVEPNQSVAAQPYVTMLDYGDSYSVESPTVIGYTPNQSKVSGMIQGDNLPDDGIIIIDVMYSPNQNTPYVVRNYFQDLNGDYVLDNSLTQNLTAATGASIYLIADSYTGFTVTTPAKTITIAADGSTAAEFYYERDYYTLNYESSDGSFIQSIYAAVGTTIDVPKDPTRAGYTFAGWSETPLSVMPAENKTITANWTPQDTTYTVIYWNENAKPNTDGSYGYAYYDQATLTAKSGSEVVISGNAFNDNNATALPTQTYFTYDHYDENVAINGDGSTFINVYYSRNSYTVTFNLNDGDGSAFVGSLPMGGTTYTTAGGIQYSFTAKYESDIRALWPTATQVSGTNNYTFVGWLAAGGSTRYTSLRLTLTSDLIDTSGTKEFFAQWSNTSVKYELHYMMETPDGSGTEYNGKYFAQDGELSQIAYSNASNWGAKTISGFTSITVVQDTDLNGDDDYDVMLYYARNAYNLKFINTGAATTTHDAVVLFDANISDRNWTPERPAYIPSYYTFDGWYTTSNFLQEQKVNWDGATMPAHALTLYAHWVPPTVTVTFDANGGSAVSSQSVTYGDKLKNPEESVRAGYLLVGWYKADGTRFNFNETVEANMTLTARWKALHNLPYTVRYVDSGGNSVAADKVVNLHTVGDTVTEDAIAVDHMAPTLLSHSIVISGISTDNVISFTYQPYTYLSYTVKYLDVTTNQSLKANLVVDATEYNRVTVRAANILGYMPLVYQKSAVLSIDPSLNVITFYYKSYTPVPPTLNGADHYAYIIGYPDGNVRPDASITRAEVATIFFRLLNDNVRDTYSTKVNGFSDVKSSNWYCRAVSTLAAMRILHGYSDGTFRPNEKITRAELAAIAARFDESDTMLQVSFNDVAGHWAEAEIDKAAGNNWIHGYSDGSFRPDQFITRAETITLINNVLNRLPEGTTDLLDTMIKWPDNADTTKWYYLAVQEATNSHYYAVKSGAVYEKWLALRPVRDWAQLEK